MPEAEEDAEGDRHREEGETVAAEGVVALADGPEKGGAADAERGDDAEDTPGDAGFARAVTAEDDAEADADHRQIPEEGEQKAERIGPRGEAQQGNGSDHDEQGTGQQGAEG